MPKRTHWTKSASPELKVLNASILVKFQGCYRRDEVRKTHRFEGRYENIYVGEDLIPELSVLMAEATAHAEKILKTEGLRMGYWFNYMPPGATTTLHSHDDDDELLSGVYYIDVPENSGNIILHPKDQPALTLPSQTGQFIFFKPEMKHEVSRNNSTRHRLSVGMNFGRA